MKTRYPALCNGLGFDYECADCGRPRQIRVDNRLDASDPLLPFSAARMVPTKALARRDGHRKRQRAVSRTPRRYLRSLKSVNASLPQISQIDGGKTKPCPLTFLSCASRLPHLLHLVDSEQLTQTAKTPPSRSQLFSEFCYREFVPSLQWLSRNSRPPPPSPTHLTHLILKSK